MNSFNDYVTISEACRILNIREVNFRKHIAANRFVKGTECRKFGTTWVFRKDAVKRKYSEFPITLNERRGKYTKENYPNMVEPKDIGEESNLLGFIPADEDLEWCPRLVIDSCVVLGFFRGYWIEDLCNPINYNKVKNNHHTPVNQNGKYMMDFKTVTDLINYILTGSGFSERYFTEEELKIVEMWLNESIDIYGNEYWGELKNIELGASK